MHNALLTATVALSRIDVAAAAAQVAAKTGRPTWLILRDLVRAMLGRQRLTAQEYFVQGAWIGSADERAAFIGKRANLRLHKSLTGAGSLGQWSLMTDKYLAGLVLDANGFPVPLAKAAHAADAPFGRLTTLATAAALADWLSDPANLPAFGKPVDGSMALGSVPLFAAGPGRVDIGGKVVDAAALAQEVAALYPRGWLIQERLRQPPEIEAMIGPGIGTVRIVTLWEDEGPELMYGVWRHPAPGTWVDAAIHGRPNVGCALDATGTVVRAQEGDLFTGREITVPPLIGYRLAQWEAMVEICRAAHRLFPGHALIGWDMAMTHRGPVIGEVNANPLHMSYQRAFRRGFLHADHRHRLDRARLLLSERAVRYQGGRPGSPRGQTARSGAPQAPDGTRTLS